MFVRGGCPTTYERVAEEFHRYHRHDLNCALHLVTSSVGAWGVFHFMLDLGGRWGAQEDDTTRTTMIVQTVIVMYALLVALTTPRRVAVAHTALVWVLCQRIGSPHQVMVEACRCRLSPNNSSLSHYFCWTVELEPWMVNLLAVAIGYGLQDAAHYLCAEPTFMNAYLREGRVGMLLLHNFWLLALVVDSVLRRHCFLPHLPLRNRNLVSIVASKSAVDALRHWIRENVQFSEETTHVWPHERKGSTADAAVTELECDQAIDAAFRAVFPAQHYDVKPVRGMNEIYVTAVGSRKSINSDAVFYMPHTDGPYWFLPGASLYRVLVGVTHNEQVRTRFNLQHPSQNQVLDKYGVLGFDYNRELHWIDHVPGSKVNGERRSVVKLHFIVYPAGWHRYGAWCARANTAYNTWARGNFLQTLRPATARDNLTAWWIWACTKLNAELELRVGWSNLTYIAAAYLLGQCDSTSWTFVLLTSFRHYVVYVTTFAYRKPPIAFGSLMRDAKLYKTISMLHLARRLWPMVDFDRDLLGLVLTLARHGPDVLWLGNGLCGTRVD